MFKLWIQRFLNKRGYTILRYATELADDELATMESVKGLTATGPQRIVGLMDAVKYIVANRIEGAVVECGVWRGGSIMAAARTLIEAGDDKRDLYLFDTFEGMSPPTEKDVMFDGTKADTLLVPGQRKEDMDNYWCYAGMESVRKNMLSTGYPEAKIHMIPGKVEDTLPQQAPERIALLRLDTDWYESTRHELVHLYPRLAPHGVLIIDDYGHWEGARRAVDEYFAGMKPRPFLNRMDYSGRLVVKPQV
jgi:hypothetical protein